MKPMEIISNVKKNVKNVRYIEFNEIACFFNFCPKETFRTKNKIGPQKTC